MAAGTGLEGFEVSRGKSLPVQTNSRGDIRQCAQSMAKTQEMSKICASGTALAIEHPSNSETAVCSLEIALIRRRKV